MRQFNFRLHCLSQALPFFVIIISLTIGDLKAQDKPVNTTAAKMEKILTTLADYDYEKSRSWLPEFQILMKDVFADPKILSSVEELMIDLLRSDASFAGKQHVCRELGNIGTTESVPVLATLITEKGMTETALLALEKIPGNEADLAMLAGLEVGDEAMKIAIINSLASRNVDDAVGPIIPLMHSPDKQLAHASIRALGNFGGERAAKALENFSSEADYYLKVPVLDAQLGCANQFFEINDIKNARIIYEKVYRSDPTYPLKYNALLGMFNTSSEDPIDFIAKYLRKEEPGFQPYIIRLLYLSDETANLEKLLNDFPNLPTVSRIHLISAAAAKGDHSFRKNILKATSEENQDVRAVAIRALGYIGKPEDVIFLAQLANEKRGTEQELARQSLVILRGTEVNETIIREISKSEAGIKAELIKCTGERNITEAIPLLFETASDADRTVRRESIRALGKLAPSEKIPEMLSLLESSPNRRERQEAERAVFALIQKMPEDSNRSAAILESLTGLDDPAAVVSLISLLGMIGDNKDLDVLRGYLNSDDGPVRVAALKALSGWQNAAPMNDLKELTETTQDQGMHTLALRGYVDVVNADPLMSSEEKFMEIRHAYSLGLNQAEYRIVISGLSRILTIDALKMAIGLLKDPGIKKEAEAAVVRIAQGTSRPHPEETVNELKNALELIEDENAVKAINQILDRLN